MPKKSRARILAEQSEQVRIKSEELLLNRSEERGDTGEYKNSSK